jgi:surface protein
MKTHLYLKSRPPFLSSGPNSKAKQNAKPKSNAAGKGRFAWFKSKVKGLFPPTVEELARMEKEREDEEKQREDEEKQRAIQRHKRKRARWRRRMLELDRIRKQALNDRIHPIDLERKREDVIQWMAKKELERKRLREAKKLERKRLRETKELERKRLMEKWEWEATHGRLGVVAEVAEEHRLRLKGVVNSKIDEMMKTWKEARLKRYRQIWAEMANRDKEPSKAAVRALFAAANKKDNNLMSRALASTSRVRTARFTVARIVVPNNKVLKMWVDDWCKFPLLWPGPRHISNWDTSQITYMGGLFWDQKAFNDDISGWDTGRVTEMGNMFNGASAFNKDIGGWDTRNVTTMSGMFNGASAFNKDIGGWDTSQVTHMIQMFYYASAFNQNLDTKEVTRNGRTYMAWDTQKLLYWSAMFIGASAFKQKKPYKREDIPWER